jgi:predicted anti-sigma-YlaC factor YlaD
MQRSRPPTRWRLAALAILIAVGLSLGGCSVRKFAVDQLGSALSKGGGAFASEEDIEFAGAAVPFSLKLIESLLLESPRNPDLLLAAASGFTQYAYGWIQTPADFLEETDPTAARLGRERAARFYLRAHNYALRGLDAEVPGFSANWPHNADAALAAAVPGDVPMLYWAAASLGAAISATKSPDLVVRVPEVAALFDRAFALNPDWNAGALHAFRVSLEPVRPGAGETGIKLAEEALAAAARVSGGTHAGALVAFAESVAVARQDAPLFRKLLQEALAIDPNAVPEQGLAIRIHQRRAKWLLDRTEDLILPPLDDFSDSP